MTALAKLSPREKRQDNTMWFTCCGETVRHWSPYTSRIYCNKCGEIVDGGDHPDDIELQEAAE